MATNPFKYSDLTYTDIQTDLNQRLLSDDRFNGSLAQAPVFQELMTQFAGMVDINNYAIQRRAEECYFDTAQLSSSIISLSRMFGYDIQRPKPATSRVRIKFKGSFTDLISTDIIQIPRFSKFTAEGNSFILKDTISIKASTFLNQVNAGQEVVIETDYYGNYITIVQGEIREKVFTALTNNLLGSSFQIYKIDDSQFSNIFGSEDYFVDPATKVYVGADKIDVNLYKIDRRSLINYALLDYASTNQKTLNNIQACVIRTTPDGFVEVMFGDNVFAKKGAVLVDDNVYIQYLGTVGSAGNAVGVTGNKVTFSGLIYTTRGVDITNRVTFELGDDIIGGTDIEDSDSIKYGSPKIFSSLDRIVSQEDYKIYLRMLNSPIDVKNAIAWGEQEQRTKNYRSDVKSFNVAFFSVVASLYDYTGGIYAPKSNLADATLDDTYSENQIQEQSIYNVYTRQLLAKQINQYNVDTTSYSWIITTKMTGKVDTLFSGLGLSKFNLGTVYIVYKTDKLINASYQTSEQTILPITISNDLTVDSFKTALVAALSSINDTRTLSSIDNVNYGLPAFTITTDDVVFTQTDLNEVTLTIGFKSTSPCYVDQFISSNTDTVFTVMGLEQNQSILTYSSPSTKVKNVSNKLITVVDDLNKKTQLTVNNVYISPLIHVMKLSGNVYVKPLFDLSETKTNTNNSIYAWLDLNADFNVSIKKSNITQLIEEQAGIDWVDYEIVPTNKFTYTNWRDDWFWTAGKDYTNLKNIIGNIFDSYLDGSNTTITEAIFWNELMKTLDEDINSVSLNSDEIQFIYVPTFYKGTSDTLGTSITSQSIINTLQAQGYFVDYGFRFNLLINNIRSALGYQIKLNLINSKGNIGIPESDDSIIGKYTVGSEIVQIDASGLNYIYNLGKN